MPFGDGTNPMDQGLGRGRGIGRGRGRMGGNRAGAGPGGFCICPNCGTKVPHQAGVPYYTVSCPKCGLRMVRA
jgi:endogenous inhibitor of DNA gyrase (YacG/DUF329 family)